MTAQGRRKDADSETAEGPAKSVPKVRGLQGLTEVLGAQSGDGGLQFNPALAADPQMIALDAGLGLVLAVLEVLDYPFAHLGTDPRLEVQDLPLQTATGSLDGTVFQGIEINSPLDQRSAEKIYHLPQLVLVFGQQHDIVIFAFDARLAALSWRWDWPYSCNMPSFAGPCR